MVSDGPRQWCLPSVVRHRRDEHGVIFAYRGLAVTKNHIAGKPCALKVDLDAGAVVMHGNLQMIFIQIRKIPRMVIAIDQRDDRVTQVGYNKVRQTE